MATMHSNSVEGNATMVSASTSTVIVSALPSNWSSLSADDKLTLVMKSVAQIPSLTTEFKLLSSKIDDFNKRLNSIQEEQSATKVKLASINTNVLANTDKISKMVTALEELREDTNLNTRKAKTLADQMASLKSSCSVNQDVSTSSTNTRVSSELIITGIPDCVTESLSSLEIASGVFEVLNISNLITDILTIRKIDKNQKTNSIDNNSNIENVKGRPKLHSFILKMKSQQVRDHIIDSRKKLRNLFIKNVFPQITDLVAETKPHVIALTETWLKPVHDYSVFCLDDYMIFRRDRNLINSKTGRVFMGGGVACLVHKSLKSKILHVSVTDHINQPEYLIIDVVSVSNCHLLLAVIYRRPQGDLNCDLLESSYVSNLLKTFISELSLYCVPYEATHHSNNKDSWLDVVLLDNRCKLGNYHKSQQPFISGHDYLICEYVFETTKKFNKIVTFRRFSDSNYNALCNSIMQSLNIDKEILKKSDPNDLLHFFHSNIIASLDEFAPLQSRKVVKAPNPWMSNELKEKCKNRDFIYKRAKRNNDIKLLRVYRSIRKQLKMEINSARENYLQNVLTNLPQGINIWGKLKHLGLLKRSDSSPLKYFNASDLNNYFDNIVRKHPPCDLDYINSLQLLCSSQVTCSFTWSKIDIVEVTKALHLTLSKSKGKSPDGLDLRWLKNHIPQISIFLTALFNRSLETGIFPQNWKTIFIIPLNKISPPRTLSDTRPIANTSHLSKVFERLIANQMMNYLETNELLDKFQSGFRKHHGTQSALLKLVDDVSKAIYDNKLTLLVLFDLTKAFDYVNPKVILKTLVELGFSYDTINWFFSYLTNRSQSVVNEQEIPVGFLETLSGVPQGSVLGPILFLLVMNSVTKRIMYSRYGLYADDTYIYIHFYPYQLQDAVRLMNIDALAVVEWARENGLEVNLLKTKAML
ncbi:uncharacterized protein LOC141525708 [Cotesia typhae]|uniref:uncharacterized protein LOC141525708 n=1 Tax=Cotesia typhae TaxID=2053667 RepID=UPI003D692CF5